MSIPKEPRQIMINLMYLVLTAMLALNVTNEILNAFKTINDSIEKTNSFVVGSNAQLYGSLDAQRQDPAARARVEPFYQKAVLVKAQADAMVAYLDGLKKQIIEKAGGINKEGAEAGHIKKASDIDIATQMFVEGRANSKQGGDDFKNKLTAYRNFLLSQVKDSNKKAIDDQLPLAQITTVAKSENNPRGDWATGNFFHMPTVAAVTLISKYVNDVRNSEGLLVQELMDEAQVGVIKFNAIQAIATPTQSYVRQGDKVGATILLAAYNQNINPTVRPSQGSITKTENGVAYWEGVANGLGEQTVSGNVSLAFNGRVESKQFTFKYTVGSAGGSIQLDKMNVFYIGLDNPVTISASGYNLEDASFNVPGAQVTKVSNGHYMVRVSQPGQIVGSVSARAQNGATSEIAKTNFRVKLIPDPVIKVGGKHGGAMLPNVLRAQEGIVAELENFVFEGVTYKVVGYTFSFAKRREDVSSQINVPSAYFTPQIKEFLNRLKAGDRVFFDDVKAQGPDGRIRNMGTMSFNLI